MLSNIGIVSYSVSLQVLQRPAAERLSVADTLRSPQEHSHSLLVCMPSPLCLLVLPGSLPFSLMGKYALMASRFRDFPFEINRSGIHVDNTASPNGRRAACPF